MPETNLTLTDRLAQSFFGGLTGAIYGVILWIFAFYFTGKSHPSVIACSAFVFASLGGVLRQPYFCGSSGFASLFMGFNKRSGRKYASLKK